ncbi:MAG: hypothetical protein JXR49_13105 [Acidobacteria bacterium]|nr:hypothetical protein [Acidobacteriota bacterium]
MTGKHLTFNVLIENDTSGVYVAYCLEAGLVATSDDPSELPHKMAKMLMRQMEFSLSNNNPKDLFRPAPREVWEKFLTARGQKVESTRRPLKFSNGTGLFLTQNAYATASSMAT